MVARIPTSLLVCVLAALATGCQSTDDEAEAAAAREEAHAVEASAPILPPFDTDLRLVELDGLSLASGLPGERPAELRFDGAEGRVSGFTGLNELHGPYTLHGHELRFGPMVMTRRGGSPPLMEQEAALGRALSRTDAWRPVDGGIELLDGSGYALARLTHTP